MYHSYDTNYDKNGVLKSKDSEFLSYLYDQYNVVDVFNIDDSLYSKNGTKFPMRMILIDSWRKDVK